MPASPHDWSDAFLGQAREDLRAAWAVSIAGGSPSTLCMLIQMVFEKLAKAAQLRKGQNFRRNHKVAAYLFAILKRHPAGRLTAQTRPNVEAFVTALENAHPALMQDQGPQLEYPWEDITRGVVYCPAVDLWLARRAGDPNDRIAIDCLKFAGALEQQWTAIFP